MHEQAGDAARRGQPRTLNLLAELALLFPDLAADSGASAQELKEAFIAVTKAQTALGKAAKKQQRAAKTKLTTAQKHLDSLRKDQAKPRIALGRAALAQKDD